MKKPICALAVTASAICLLGLTAHAGNNFSGYNTTVGKMNGNGYSGYQTKSTGGANGYIISTSVGGNYVVDARMNCNKGNAPWKRNITDGTSGSLPGYYKQTAGESIRIQFSNDITTPVDVQVVGKWKSN